MGTFDLPDERYLYFDDYRITGDKYNFKVQEKLVPRKTTPKNTPATYGDNSYFPTLSKVIRDIGERIARKYMPDIVAIEKKLDDLEYYVKKTFDADVDYRTFLKE